MIEVITSLLIKHFLADYVFNPAYTVPVDKHIYGGRGGLEHTAMHMFWTFALLVWILPVQTVCYVALFDGFIHYHEDWIKTKYLYKRKGLSEQFRRCITGFDQLVHMLTYVAITYFVT